MIGLNAEFEAVTPEDLSGCELYRELYDGFCSVGFDADAALRVVLLIAHNYGGAKLYLPLAKQVLRPSRDRRIKAEFTGFNHRALARSFGMTEDHVRRIIQRRPGVGE